ncbi:hypothetical protein ACFV4I_21135 [Nocardiopsis alba]|uniref:hypothetical protein n=1 Tax=Nocardiopsis alba TaxID=53437 RepID=UPI00365BAC9D
MPTSTTPRPDTGIVTDVAQGPAASYAGLRTAVRAVLEAGADLTPVAEHDPAAWALLAPDGHEPVEGAPLLSEIALAPSERRLHRESEQVFRVLNTAAAALCQASSGLGRPLVIRHAGATDLTSLRGLMRAHEYALTVPGARLEFSDADVTTLAAGEDEDYRFERSLCLARMGVSVAPERMRPLAPRVLEPDTAEQVLYDRALSREASAEDRLVAALAYSRSAFFSGNWEGMATVARAALPLTRGLSDGSVHGMLDAARSDEQSEAIEFEPTELSSAADLRAFLHKVLGIQASFRGRQDDAVRHFARMRADGDRLSPESLAQSHLYVALVETKRLGRLEDAAAELESGLALLEAESATRDSIRRERGWLNNLRALVYFRQKRFRSAFTHEQRALECINGLNDASSIHLRINLLSNVSVLQEKAGQVENAVRTWERFRSASGSENTSFRKHHSYRAGGLSLLAGRTAAGIAELGTSLEGALSHRDDFHEYEIRVELGSLVARDGNADTAHRHFTLAREAGLRLGDPLRTAVAEAGAAAVLGAGVPAGVHDLLASSVTGPGRARDLAEGFRKGPREVLESLPLPRTKLNRPFDTVNFQE